MSLAEITRINRPDWRTVNVIYYWWDGGRQFWLFTLYDKDEMDDLSAMEKKAIKSMLTAELENRQ